MQKLNEFKFLQSFFVIKFLGNEVELFKFKNLVLYLFFTKTQSHI